MNNRKQIENILKINGVSPTAHDEEIRSILLSARFNSDEVDTALVVLRENTITNKNRVDGLHKVFRTDESLNSDEIMSLLGVDVDLEHRVMAGSKAKDVTSMTQAILFLTASVIGLFAVILYMYVLKMGVFHPSSAIAFTLFQ